MGTDYFQGMKESLRRRPISTVTADGRPSVPCPFSLVLLVKVIPVFTILNSFPNGYKKAFLENTKRTLSKKPKLH